MTTLEQQEAQTKTTSNNDDRLVHIVRRGSWPFALCGAIVRELKQLSAPGMDRCVTCQDIAHKNGHKLTGFYDVKKED
jgi:hypothetical protein